MCEELNTTTQTEETPQVEDAVTSPEKLPMEQWWGEDREEVECVDVTPELPPQPVVVPPQPPQYTYAPPQPVQPVAPQPQPQYYPPQQPQYTQSVPPQQIYYQQPYLQLAPQKNELSLASLVLGIVALIIGFFPFFGWAADIAAIITGVISKKKGDQTSRATMGIVFGAIGALVGFMFIALCVGLAYKPEA